jgi:hypothetical protein
MSAFSYKQVNSTELISKDIQVGHVATPMRYLGKLTQIKIGTTGDPDATAKATEILQRLISKAGQPSKAFIQEGERQQAAAQAEEQRKQEEQARAEQEAADRVNGKLQILTGHWHATYGMSDRISGQVTNQFSPTGSAEGTVNVFLDADYDLVMEEPHAGQVIGVYTISNYRRKLAKSGSVVYDFVCFNVGSQCYQTYAYNKTQTYDVMATVSGTDYKIRMTHRGCDGDCSESSRHMPDHSEEARFESNYIMRLDSHKYLKQ